MKLPKLSKPQTDLFNLLRKGWSLGRSTSSISRSFVQEGKLGGGGTAKDVRAETIFAIEKAGLITPCNYGFPHQEYKLSAYGKVVSKAMAIEEAKSGKDAS